MSTLFDQIELGPLTLPNRVLMAPLTRSRAQQPGDVPWSLNAEYYAQRAGAGLIVAEATYVHPMGKGYAFIPGIATDAQRDGWKLVTDAVHDAGGRIFLQLFHSGRVSHVDLLGGKDPVGPSALPVETMTYTETSNGMVPVSPARALETGEVREHIDAFADGARRAMEAGFDGVEIHGANGYLLDQFTRDGSNQRDDEWGGSLENRLRFPVEVAKAVSAVVGADRVGYRISPTGVFNGMEDSDPAGTFGALARELSAIGLAYLHVAESFAGSERDEAVLGPIRAAFDGVYIANGGYTKALAHERMGAGKADAVAFGETFLANPDLPARLEQDAALNDPDHDTYYGGDATGYTDYPTLAGVGA